MGSRIMHYCIAALLIERLEMDQEQRLAFLLGGVAPDIQPFMDGVRPKDRTHFVDRDEQGIGAINISRYCAKYKEQLHEPFYRGYLCHLVSDVVWTEMWYSAVAPKPEEERKLWLAACYRDFWRLNGRLVEKFQLQQQPLADALPAIRMDEAEYGRLVPLLIAALERDFNYEPQTVREPLELFHDDNHEIVHYINVCVDRSMAALHTLA